MHLFSPGSSAKARKLKKELTKRMEVLAMGAKMNESEPELLRITINSPGLHAAAIDFDFIRGAKHLNAMGPNILEVRWDDASPRTAVSKDGVKVLHYLPGALSQKAVVCQAISSFYNI
jgi:hypothetical protein